MQLCSAGGRPNQLLGVDALPIALRWWGRLGRVLHWPLVPRPHHLTLSLNRRSPAATAAYAQLTILTKLEQHGMRLVAPAQPPLFQSSGDNWQTPQDAQPVMVLNAPQLLVLPGINIEVR